MDVVSGRYRPSGDLFTSSVLQAPKGGVMQDLAYIGLTILVFAVLFLIVRGVERFER